MYQKTLVVGLLALSPDVAKSFRLAKAPEQILLHFHTLSATEDPLLNECDIVIFTSDNLDIIQKNLSKRPPTPRFILCASPATAETIDACLLENLFDVWPLLLSPDLAALFFRRLLDYEKIQTDLTLADQCLDTTINSIPSLVWFKNTNGIYFKANTAFYETVGKEKLQVEGRDHYFVWDVDPHDCSYDEFACPRSDRETLQTKDTLIFDEQIKTPRGMRQFKTYKSPLFDTAGNTMGTVGVANDVTDLGNIATQMDILINSLPFSVVVEDTQETILNMNSKTEEYFNVKQTEVLGGKISTWRRKVFGDELASKREKEETNEFTVCINDVCKTLEFTHVPIVDVFGNITGKLRIYRDITSERELEAKATLSARTDYLTGLYNRRYFYEYLNLHRDKSPLTLVSLDLNGFKEINDRYGHAAGDEALVKVSQALQEAFPQELVTRWGGDEFVVALMGDHSAEQVSYAIAEVLDQLKEQAKLEDSAWSISASVGIAQTNDPLLPIDEVIRRSDDALYHSKRAGGKPHIAEVQ